MNVNDKIEIMNYYNVNIILTKNFLPEHALIIVDPINKSNNVGKSSFQYVNIKVKILI